MDQETGPLFLYGLRTLRRLTVPQLDIPVREVEEVFPTVVVVGGDGDVDEGSPFRAFGLANELHADLMWEAVALFRVAGDAGTHNVFPCGQTAFFPGQDMIQIQFRAVEDDAAILTGIRIALEDIVTRELDFFFWKTVKKKEDDHPRDSHRERDRFDHFLLWLQVGKVAPTLKIMSQKIV